MREIRGDENPDVQPATVRAASEWLLNQPENPLAEKDLVLSGTEGEADLPF